MATKYYSDGTYTKGDGKLYYPGIGVVGRDKSTNVSKAESGSSTPINNTKTKTKTKTNSNSNSSSSSNRYNTTVTKKDGSTASGYIEDGKSYYSDGTRIGAGDSVVDAQGKVWTMSGNSDHDAGLSINDYLAKYGVSAPTGGGSSSSGSYKVTSSDKPERTSYLRSARELADLYDINYDMDAIKSIYDNATDAKYALLSKELEQSENDFYTNQANANATLLDTLRKATSSAIATGASRGIAGAEQLGLMMEAQQEAVAGATDLAQQRANMADKIAAEKAENIINALEYSDNLKKTLGNLSSNIYSPDTQYDVGLLDWAAQMKNVEALFEQIGAEERANLASILSNEKIADANRIADAIEGDKNRASNEKIAADNAAAQKAYYDYMKANAGSSGGYGSGGYNYNDYISELLKRSQASDLTLSTGNRTLATTNLLNQGFSSEEAEQVLNTNIDFLMSEKFGGTANIPEGMTAATFSNYLWNIGDMDTLAKIIAAQDTTTKSYSEKLKDAQKQIQSDKQIKLNNKAGGYNNRSDVIKYNNINTWLTKAKQEYTQNNTVSDTTYKEIASAINRLSGDYAFVSSEFSKKYNTSIRNLMDSSSKVTLNKLNNFIKNYMN